MSTNQKSIITCQPIRRKYSHLAEVWVQEHLQIHLTEQEQEHSGLLALILLIFLLETGYAGLGLGQGIFLLITELLDQGH